jgi:L-asparaginase / beta-aspartyl-peptidase
LGKNSDWSIVLHGGAGVAEHKDMPPEREAAFRAGMAAGLAAGVAVLAAGGSALDAVQAAVEVLEDDPLFNAGRGAAFTADGANELDAAIMDGSSLSAGAVGGVTRTRHPIALARAVMERSPHVMLVGQGADGFAASVGLEQVDPSFFFTGSRWRALETELTMLGLPIPPGGERAGAAAPEPDDHRFGTVGAVARDGAGRLAAATSTGGMTAKRWGRVGDSPIIGAGTYAADDACAVSGTGSGEYFIRLTLAREVAALVKYKGLSLQAAVDEAIQDQLTDLGGEGGVIAVGAGGEMAWSYNTRAMFRARAESSGERLIAIFKDEA